MPWRAAAGRGGASYFESNQYSTAGSYGGTPAVQYGQAVPPPPPAPSAYGPSSQPGAPVGYAPAPAAGFGAAAGGFGAGAPAPSGGSSGYGPSFGGGGFGSAYGAAPAPSPPPPPPAPQQVTLLSLKTYRRRHGSCSVNCACVQGFIRQGALASWPEPAVRAEQVAAPAQYAPQGGAGGGLAAGVGGAYGGAGGYASQQPPPPNSQGGYGASAYGQPQARGAPRLCDFVYVRDCFQAIQTANI